MDIAANDNGQLFDVLFFDSNSDDANVTHRVSGFTNLESAITYTTEAYEYAKANGIEWFGTEIVDA